MGLLFSFQKNYPIEAWRYMINFNGVSVEGYRMRTAYGWASYTSYLHELFYFHKKLSDIFDNGFLPQK